MFSLFYSAFTNEYVYAVFMLFLLSECVCAVHGSFTSEYVYAVLCYFSRANVFTLFMVLSRANMFTLFYVIFSRANLFTLFLVLSRANRFMLCYVFFLKRMCLRCLWYFHERMCFCCVYAVYGTFTSAYVFAVYVIFSRANVFTLFMVLLRANMFIMLFFLTRMCLHWVMCSFLLANMFSLFMAPYNMSTLLWYSFFFYQRANMFMLLCGTLTSEYVLRCYMLLLQANMATLVYGILSQAIMFAQLCVPTVGVIYVTCEIWVYEICFYFLSFLCMA